MKSIKEYIIERNSPDKITIKDKDNYGGNFSFMSDKARAFLFDIKDNKAIFARETAATHGDVVYYLKYNDNELWQKLGLDKAYSTTDFRYDPSVGTYDNWIKRHPEASQKLCTGRLWDIMWEDQPSLFIAWWDELTQNKFIKYNTKLIEDYFNENFNEMNGSDIDDYKIYCVDNNGKLFEWNYKDNKEVKIDKRSEESKEWYGIRKAIHDADAKAKQKFFANFKRYRDEKNQKIYNHTKSKTEAEYRALKYQESLEDTK